MAGAVTRAWRDSHRASALSRRSRPAHHEDVPDCPFCGPPEETLAANALAIAFPDRYPVSPGHTLVIPRRHVATYFDCTADEKRALWELVDVVHAILADRAPDGFNVGINTTGAAAGQTVFHAHIHVIPRFVGDHPDPRGGVRAVMPGRTVPGASEP